MAIPDRQKVTGTGRGTVYDRVLRSTVFVIAHFGVLVPAFGAEVVGAMDHFIMNRTPACRWVSMPNLFRGRHDGDIQSTPSAGVGKS